MLPGVTVHYGHFLATRPTMPRADSPGSVRVVKYEEKGTDVNLATHLLLDAFDGDCEGALVISNDSDLTEPIRVVRERFGRPVGVAFPILNRNPDGKRRPPSNTLRAAATFERFVTDSRRHRRLLAASQLPGAPGSLRDGRTSAVK